MKRYDNITIAKVTNTLGSCPKAEFTDGVAASGTAVGEYDSDGVHIGE